MRFRTKHFLMMLGIALLIALPVFAEDGNSDEELIPETSADLYSEDMQPDGMEQDASAELSDAAMEQNENDMVTDDAEPYAPEAEEVAAADEQPEETIVTEVDEGIDTGVAEHMTENAPEPTDTDAEDEDDGLLPVRPESARAVFGQEA